MIDLWVIDFKAAFEITLFEFRPAEPMQLIEDEHDAWAEEDAYVAPVGPTPINMNEIQRKVKEELREYREMQRINMREMQEDGKRGDFTDPLKWWKHHLLRFPTLGKIARKYLCIPATSAPSERVFSLAGLTISKIRSRLDSENASCLICVRDNWDTYEEIKSKMDARQVVPRFPCLANSYQIIFG